MKVILAGPANSAFTAEHEAKIQDSGHTVITPEHMPEDGANVGRLLHFVCTEVDAVHMMPEWRRCRTARAMRAAAVASGVLVLGFS